jgi:lactoylglutathione lyase
MAYCEMIEGLDVETDLWPSDWREKFQGDKKMAFITDPDGYEVEILEH